MINAVFFDWDGTLMDDEPSSRRTVSATAEAITERLPGIDPADLTAAYYAAVEEAWNEVKLVRSAPWGNMDDSAIVRRVWGGALQRLGVAGPSMATEAAETWARFRLSDVPLFEDVIPCLDALHGRYLLGVITNGSIATHLPRIEASGLRRYFSSVTTTDIGTAKPLHAIFSHALASVDAKPHRALHVGDSLFNDVGGANGAGLFSTWINRSGIKLSADDPIPDAEISSLHELPGVLDRLRP